MGFNILSLKKRRIGVKGLVFAFEALDTGSDFLDICGEVGSTWMREMLELSYIFPFCLEGDHEIL